MARVDNRDELAAALGIERPLLARMSDRKLVMRAFEQAGDAGLAKIVGAFAFAYWDEADRRLVLARDCLGSAPLFYCVQQDFIAFATTLKSLLAFPGVPREIDQIGLGHFLGDHLNAPGGTLYRGIERVPSRTRLSIDRSGLDQAKYWTPDLHARPYAREQDYVERARELFDQAVLAAMRDTPRASLLLSGGLDSSAIAATCARLGLAERLSCYTGVPPAETTIDVGDGRYANEHPKVEALRRLHPALDVKYVVPPALHPVDLDATRYFARYDLPARNVTNLGWFLGIEDAMAPDAQTHLVGVYGNFGLTWDGLFSLVELLKSFHLRKFSREVGATARESGQSVMRTLKAEVGRRLMPDSLYRSHHRLRGRNPDDVTRFSLLNPEFAGDVGLAAQWRAQGYDPYHALRGTSGPQWRAFHLFDGNQLARDARAQRYWSDGKQIRVPHADRRLLEFCLSVPEPMYRQNGIPRSFARRVLADRLPAEILHERRRGVQSPLWFRTLNARRNDIAREVERFEASALARCVLDLPRMRRLLAEWPCDETAAQSRNRDYKFALARGVHVGQFICWLEGANA